MKKSRITDIDVYKTIDRFNKPRIDETHISVGASVNNNSSAINGEYRIFSSLGE